MNHNVVFLMLFSRYYVIKLSVLINPFSLRNIR